MKYLTILIIVTLISCQPKNVDFNPFDKEFRFHGDFQIAQYDSIWGECGYWNLTKDNDRLDIYYQFYDDEKEIVAKGFDLDIDEIDTKLDSETDLYDDNFQLQLFRDYPLDLSKIQNELLGLKIKSLTVALDTPKFRNIEITDTSDSIYYADLLTFYERGKIVRRLSYFNGNNN